MTRQWVIVGCGGHGREVADVLQVLGEKVLGYVDNNPERTGTTVGDLEVLGTHEWINDHPGPLAVALGIGSSKVRKVVADQLMGMQKKLDFPPIIHPNSYIGSRVCIGKGTFIQAGCVLTCDIEVGAFVVLNVGVGLSHDVRIGDYATLAPQAHMAGRVHIHALAEIGMGTQVIQTHSVGERASTGAGAVVIRDVKPEAKVVGVPARDIRSTAEAWQTCPGMTGSRPVISIVGAGMYGSVIKELAEACGYRVIAFYDDDPRKAGTILDEVPVHSTTQLNDAAINGNQFAIAIGNNLTRTQIAAWLTEKGGVIPTLIHPSAYISPSASIGLGCFVHAHACIWTNARLGDFSIISPLTTIAHHAVLGDGTLSAAGSTIGSGVEIGQRSFIGMGSTVSTTVTRVEPDCVIGAGSTVIRDVSAGSTVAGVPARVITHR